LPTPDPGWGLEISLDLDAVSATVRAARSAVEATAIAARPRPAVETAVALGADAVSNSYGSRGEFSGDSTSSATTSTPVWRSRSVGRYGYGNGRILIGSVSYPGASQFVTSVGGTALVRDDSERGWTRRRGRVDERLLGVHPQPGWQKDRLCDKRTVADVAR